MLDKKTLNSIFKAALKFELNKYRHIKFAYTEEGVPETGKAIHAMFLNALQYGGLFKVYSGANDKTYFAPETNLLYRALHDLHHAEAYATGAGGTTKVVDEKRLNCKMAYTAYSYALAKFGYEVALQLFFTVYHDTVGQVEYYSLTKEFCKDQNALTTELLEFCSGMYYLRLGRTSQAKQVMLGYMSQCDFKV